MFTVLVLLVTVVCARVLRWRRERANAVGVLAEAVRVDCAVTRQDAVRLARAHWTADDVASLHGRVPDCRQGQCPLLLVTGGAFGSLDVHLVLPWLLMLADHPAQPLWASAEVVTSTAARWNDKFEPAGAALAYACGLRFEQVAMLHYSTELTREHVLDLVWDEAYREYRDAVGDREWAEDLAA